MRDPVFEAVVRQWTMLIHDSENENDQVFWRELLKKMESAYNAGFRDGIKERSTGSNQ